jgi:hypothetical protein
MPVDVDGVRHGLFADVKLHQAMLNAGTGPGCELTVTKTQETYEKDGEQRRFNTFIVEGGTGTPTQAAPAGNAVAAPPTPPPAGDAKETYKIDDAPLQTVHCSSRKNVYRLRLYDR